MWLRLSIMCLSIIALPAQSNKNDLVHYQAAADGVLAQARYVSGEPTKPAVLILHGFLATHQFSTVQTLQDFLSFEGYSTLAPTLSLQIPLRNQSLNCNSLHTHTLQQDINEIHGWIKWLENRGHKQIVLIGHSSGSQQLLEALIQHQPASVKALISTSLFYLNGEELGIRQQDLQIAQQQLEQTQPVPQKFNFLYCQQDYLATAESYLSYLVITRKQVIQNLNQLRLPTYTIMGSADSRYQLVGESWLQELADTSTQLITIAGANHFFAQQHEVTLQQQIQHILNKLEGLND